MKASKPKRRTRYVEYKGISAIPGLFVMDTPMGTNPYVAPEETFVCEHGEVWRASDTTYKAVLRRNTLSQYLPPEKQRVDLSDEVVITFGLEDLQLWLKRMVVVKDVKRATRMANRF